MLRGAQDVAGIVPIALHADRPEQLQRHGFGQAHDGVERRPQFVGFIWARNSLFALFALSASVLASSAAAFGDQPLGHVDRRDQGGGPAGIVDPVAHQVDDDLPPIGDVDGATGRPSTSPSGSRAWIRARTCS